MKYFKVTAKCGHVGKNNYYRGNLFIKAESGKEAAKIARDIPRVKHDRKDAILDVQEIDFETFETGRMINHGIHYYTCESKQEQNYYLYEIEENIFVEENGDFDKKLTKRHSLRNVYNSDPAYDTYKKTRQLADLEYFIA